MSNSSSISPTICSMTSSIVTRPATPPYSSTTIAMWLRLPRNSFSSTFRRLDSGTNTAGRRYSRMSKRCRARRRTAAAGPWPAGCRPRRRDRRRAPGSASGRDSTTAAQDARERLLASHAHHLRARHHDVAHLQIGHVQHALEHGERSASSTPRCLRSASISTSCARSLRPAASVRVMRARQRPVALVRARLLGRSLRHACQCSIRPRPASGTLDRGWRCPSARSTRISRRSMRRASSGVRGRSPADAARRAPPGAPSAPARSCAARAPRRAAPPGRSPGRRAAAACAGRARQCAGNDSTLVAWSRPR